MKILKSNTTNFVNYALCVFLSTVLTSCDWLRITYAEDESEYDPTPFLAKEDFSYTLFVENQTQLRLECDGGPVNITGSQAADSVLNWGQKRVWSESYADAEKHLEDIGLFVKENAEEIFFKSTQPEDRPDRRYAVNHNVTLPAYLDLIIDNDQGHVFIDSVNSRVSVLMRVGKIHLKEINGSVLATVENHASILGNIILPLAGVIEMTADEGFISLAIPKTTSAEISLEALRIEVTNLEVSDVVVTEHSYKGKLSDGRGKIKLKNVNGTIRLRGY